MSAPLRPQTLAELSEAVRSAPRIVAVGAGTKPRLSAVEGTRLSTAGLTGLVEYEPEEFTFTARAGTPLRDLAAALAERGQYLPFDPPWVAAGATLGGAVASGLSGPGRYRFGGIRDFILGVRFVDGAGRLLRLGGKVVKNAAGFDVPKFLCGSLGRFGVIGEVTFKVFPRPVSALTLRLHAADPVERLKIIRALGRSRWEPEAVEGVPDHCDLWVRLAGPESALAALASEILTRFPGRRETGMEDPLEALREMSWAAANDTWVKVPLSPDHTVAFTTELAALDGVSHQVGAGGSVGWIAIRESASVPDVRDLLERFGLEGMTLRGDAPLWWARRPRPAIESAVKLALDPCHRFPPLDS